MKTAPTGGNGVHGMNWIRPEKRLAIYLRDGLACAWCGASVEDAAVVLTLDHLKCRSKGGSNDPTNLVTACRTCNASRGLRSLKSFAKAVAHYLNGGTTAEKILAFIEQTRKRPLDVAAAKALISVRGGFSAALKPGRK